MADSRPVIQHWVPQFYLKYFATPATRDSRIPKVCLWDLDAGKSIPGATSTKNVCGRRYLYSPEDALGVRDWSQESDFDRLESQASSLWPELLAGRAPTSDTDVRRLLALFVAAMHLRNVGIFNMIDRGIELREKLFPLSSELLAARAPSDPDPTHSGRNFAHLLRSGIGRISEGLFAKRWAILKTDGEVFLTSDRPVSFTKGGHRSGPGNPGSSLYLPLSPSHLLFMDDNTTHPGDVVVQWKGPPLQVANTLTHANALGFLISHKSLPEFAAEYQPVGWMPDAPRPPRKPPRAKDAKV